MPRHPRYSVHAPTDGTMAALCERLNRPRHPESGDPGLGPNTCRDDASTYLGLSEDPTGLATRRWFAISIPPRDVERFEAICDEIEGVRYARWHPEGADGEYQHPSEHYQADGLERIEEGDTI